MSEIQNKAVALVTQIEGDPSLKSPPDRSAQFLRSAIDLYFALGGDAVQAAKIIADGQTARPCRVESAVANVIVELAVASHINDLDMVQAAYNRLDAELKTPHNHHR